MEDPNDPYPRLQAPRRSNEEENDLEVEEEDDPSIYRVGRDGDHLMGVPFECDLCHFRNMNRRDPISGSPKDDRTITAIRRAQLDVFWSRRPGTVGASLGRLRRDYREVHERCNVGRALLPYFPTDKVMDRVGMAAAITMLTASLRPGRNSDRVQHASARRTRTSIHNVWNSSSRYIGVAAPGLARMKGEFLSGSPTDEDWWARFNKGAKLRMGEQRSQDEALTAAMVVALGRVLDEKWRSPATSSGGKEKLEELMSYVLVGFGAGLRGEEVPLVSLEGMQFFWGETKAAEDPYIMVTLRGRFKGETGHRWHCLPIADRTRSGVPHRQWIGRLMYRRVVLQGRTGGWLFPGNKGGKARMSKYEGPFVEAMSLLHESEPELFSVGTTLDLFSLKRSLRRGAIQAVGDRVSPNVVNMMNRWRKRERARGTEPGLDMRQTYTQVRGMVDELKLYSQAM